MNVNKLFWLVFHTKLFVWTVKVKDQQSQHNEQKFQVASLHPGTMLSKPGVDVTFRVDKNPAVMAGRRVLFFRIEAQG